MIIKNFFDPFIIEWLALIIGTIGTILWSIGWNQLTVSILWLLSSLLWIVFALSNEHYALTARDMLGVFLYIIGIKTYWKNKKIEDFEKLKIKEEKCIICKGIGLHQLSGPGTSTCSCNKK